jgi:hypothetical protein
MIMKYTGSLVGMAARGIAALTPSECILPTDIFTLEISSQTMFEKYETLCRTLFSCFINGRI